MNTVRLRENSYSTKRSIKNLQSDEQPREKMLLHGPEALSDAELIAMLLRSGSKEMNVIETSRALLDECKGIKGILKRNWQELAQIKGIGKVKAITLLAAVELSTRLQESWDEEDIILNTPEKVNQHFGPRLRNLTKEVFMVVYLNSAKKMTGYDKISLGGANATVVDPPEIMRMSILNRAHTILLIHNHPSGNNKPSSADISLTNRLVQAGKMVGIEITDHIIICGNSYYSFRTTGLI